MAWNDDDWRVLCMLVEEGWPGEFGESARQAWRMMLDRYDPEPVVAALNRFVARGGTFRPSVSELVGELRADPSRPTADEMIRLVFGSRGVLRARPAGALTYGTEAERRRLYNTAALERADQMHPLIGAWCRARGVQELRELQLDDPAYGDLRRRELRESWDAFVERAEEREIAVLVAGGDREAGLRALDPLAALDLDPPPVRSLESGREAA